MSKGCNSTVVSVRLPDELVKDLEALARKRRRTVTELLRPVIKKFVGRASARRSVRHWGVPVGEDSFDNQAVGERPGVVEGGVVGMVYSQSKEGHFGVKGDDACPCGSSKRFRDCCRSKLL